MARAGTMVMEGVIMGLISAIISLKFLAVDAYLFNLQPPKWANEIANAIPMNGIIIDIMMTIDLFLLVLLFIQQGDRPE
jgi:hypothetical protein